MKPQKRPRPTTRAARDLRAKLARERAARRATSRTALLRNATRNAQRPARQRRTVVQICVRLTAVEDRALAGLIERGAFPSVTDAIRSLIRDRAALEPEAAES